MLVLIPSTKKFIVSLYNLIPFCWVIFQLVDEKELCKNSYLLKPITTFPNFHRMKYIALFKAIYALYFQIFPTAYHYCNNKGLYQVNAESDADTLKPNEQHVHLSKKWPSISARKHSFQPIPLLSMEHNLKEHCDRKARKHVSNLVRVDFLSFGLKYLVILSKATFLKKHLRKKYFFYIFYLYSIEIIFIFIFCFIISLFSLSLIANILYI